jgi:hypothetical protein
MQVNAAARLGRLCLAGLGLAALAVVSCSSLDAKVGERTPQCVDGDSDPTKTVSFKDELRPLMNGDIPGTKGCASCHYQSRGTRQGLEQTGLNLESLGTMRKGGANTGANVIVPKSPCKSFVVQKLQGTAPMGAQMPKEGPYWGPREVQLMIDWIAEGAIGGDSE